jgi:hypothetical protein
VAEIALKSIFIRKSSFVLMVRTECICITRSSFDPEHFFLWWLHVGALGRSEMRVAHVSLHLPMAWQAGRGGPFFNATLTRAAAAAAAGL